MRINLEGGRAASLLHNEDNDDEFEFTTQDKLIDATSVTHMFKVCLVPHPQHRTLGQLHMVTGLGSSCYDICYLFISCVSGCEYPVCYVSNTLNS